MNVHHLELFYYVAKHGGISAAVRHIPYGIQQPAVSGQMTRLEEDAGARLFERSPFRLTPAGEQLFAHIQPFFENLAPLAQELRAESRPELRIGGSELVLRDHVPSVMRHVRAHYPLVRLTLHTGYQAQVEDWAREGKIDLAITSAGPRPPAKLRQLPLVRIPLVLLVHRATPWKNAEDILARKKIPEPLVGQPAGTSFMQSFQRDLKRRRIAWPQAVEATSVELVMRYVANGEGFGVINRAALASVKNREIRVLPLDGFEPMLMAVLWRGEASALLREVVEGVQRYAHETFPDWKCADVPPWRVPGGAAAEGDGAQRGEPAANEGEAP
ncbi:MAG: LysR family transcriptional regulator [Verrucomicrobia bacterium]|nr:LysR family transcriptional regulator [Verrucomicrobiota bacterium]